MGLLDDYSQLDDLGSDDDTGADPADARRKRSDLERQIVILDSDLRKLLRTKQDSEMDQRRLKKQEERVRVERDALAEKIKKMEESQRLLEDEIKGLKKKLKTLPTAHSQ